MKRYCHGNTDVEASVAKRVSLSHSSFIINVLECEIFYCILSGAGWLGHGIRDWMGTLPYRCSLEARTHLGTHTHAHTERRGCELDSHTNRCFARTHANWSLRSLAHSSYGSARGRGVATHTHTHTWTDRQTEKHIQRLTNTHTLRQRYNTHTHTWGTFHQFTGARECSALPFSANTKFSKLII